MVGSSPKQKKPLREAWAEIPGGNQPKRKGTFTRMAQPRSPRRAGSRYLERPERVRKAYESILRGVIYESQNFLRASREVKSQNFLRASRKVRSQNFLRASRKEKKKKEKKSRGT